ncbi:IS1182 family transposase [Synechococcus sp. CBW1002]|nr:IS1182 family transposase [Synechococcus sp. CBW1002]QPN58442.1 IS1182 family transposase [Synechococcus sp. CBW1002]QPN58453.1 IS1182 family transposase [Synechococcus sp. CBW1002]
MSKPKTFRPWTPGQTSLMPPSPIDWLPSDHLVFFLLELVEELDFALIMSPARQKDARGEKGYDPRMLTLLLLYAYCIGMASSRKIERACHEDAAFRVLTGNQQPDHSRISDFRRRHLGALEELFVQILRLCQKAGMVSLGQVALDGTKVKANASKHKAMSHQRMLKSEEQLEQEIRELLRKAEILDAQEDGRYGKGKRGSDLPEALSRREDRLERIRQARRELEAETAAAAARERQEQAAAAAKAAEEGPEQQRQECSKTADRVVEKAAAAKDLAIAKANEAGLGPPDLEPLAADQMPHRGLAHKACGTPTKGSQRNFTDPASHIMKSDGNWIQGYNCQAAVDGDYQVIVAIGVSNQPPDVEHLEPMLERTIANTAQLPKTLIADAGYWSEANAEACTARGVDPHIATGREKHGQPPAPTRGPIPKNLDAKGRMNRKLRCKKGREIYARRKTIVEPVFGQTKECRGLRRFLLRGLDNVNGEWALWCLTHNINKLFRFKAALAA